MRALEAGFEIGAKPIDVGIVEAILSSQLDDLEPQLSAMVTTCAAWSSSSTPSRPRSAGYYRLTFLLAIVSRAVSAVTIWIASPSKVRLVPGRAPRV